MAGFEPTSYGSTNRRVTFDTTFQVIKLERGRIRTHGVLHDDFQNRCLKPLSHPFKTN